MKKAILQALGDVKTGLAGLVSLNGLPAAAQTGLATVITGVEAASLKVAAAPDEAASPEDLKAFVALCGSAITVSGDTAKAALAAAAEAKTSLNGLVEQAVAAKVKDGLLVTKEAHDAAVTGVKESALTEGFSKGKEFVVALNGRAKLVTDAGLPAAPDAVLNEPDAKKFEDALGSAKANLTAAKSAGLEGVKSLNGVMWSGADTFKVVLAPLVELQAAVKAGGGTIPAILGAPSAEPNTGKGDARKAC
jgi:hypothetical protein